MELSALYINMEFFSFLTDESNGEKPQLNSTSKPKSQISSEGNYTSIIWTDENYENPELLESRYLQGQEMAVYLAREDAEILALLGHQFDEMVLSCTFRGVSCR